MFNALLKTYENFNNLVCPIAHTTLKIDIAVIVNDDGDVLGCQVVNGYMCVPCTIESESRTSGTSPHLLADNLSYIGNLPGCENRYSAYIGQLENYIKSVNDPLAKTIYNFYNKYDINKIISARLAEVLKTGKQKKAVNVAVIPYGRLNIISPEWTNYYINSLPKNGTCIVTGELDHMPKNYPAKMRHNGDFAKLLISKESGLKSIKSFSNVGYVAGQKISHALQFIIWYKNELGEEFLKMCDGDIDRAAFITEYWPNVMYDSKKKDFYTNRIVV